VNHICNALLVSLLHPALKKAAQAKKSHEDKFPRINLVASDTHFWALSPLPNDPYPVQTILKKPGKEIKKKKKKKRKKGEVRTNFFFLLSFPFFFFVIPITETTPPLGVYPSTKLMNILFAKAYAEKCPDPIWICSTNPGYTDSELGSKDPATGSGSKKREPLMKIRFALSPSPPLSPLSLPLLFYLFQT
jgi:hypothetical protein